MVKGGGAHGQEQQADQIGPVEGRQDAGGRQVVESGKVEGWQHPGEGVSEDRRGGSKPPRRFLQWLASRASPLARRRGPDSVRVLRLLVRSGGLSLACLCRCNGRVETPALMHERLLSDAMRVESRVTGCDEDVGD